MATMKYARLELGTVEAVFNKLGGLEGAEKFLRGDVELVIRKHVIDLDADPLVPDGWKVEEHRQGGQFEWDPAKVSPYLSERQKGGCVQGHKLRQELQGQRVLNANLLDYLLEHPELIPDEWKGKFVFFWGTIYRSHAYGHLYVRYLYWGGDGWDWYYYCLDDDWNGHNPAAVSAS